MQLRKYSVCRGPCLCQGGAELDWPVCHSPDSLLILIFFIASVYLFFNKNYIEDKQHDYYTAL